LGRGEEADLKVQEIKCVRVASQIRVCSTGQMRRFPQWQQASNQVVFCLNKSLE